LDWLNFALLARPESRELVILSVAQGCRATVFFSESFAQGPAAMRHRILFCLLLCLTFAPLQGGEAIRLKLLGEWSSGNDDAAALLRSVAREFEKLFPDAKLPLIEVEENGGPITLFQRGPAGEIRVKLDTGRRLWAQHAFQFAHELCHVHCRYDDDKHRNKWFEESLCELASLCMLRRMSESWKTDPPYENWKDYAPRLFEYAEERRKRAELKDGETLAGWYAARAEMFYKNAIDREANLVVATALLPLFEEDPDRWQAVWYLNVEHHTPAFTFRDHLAAWQRNAPEKHRAFIATIAARFGLSL
jgi:hypothetical protein